ncbi:peptidyl-prolyl cis-trans isomerase SurA [Tenacibaculum sp. 190524A02b]|uniref:Peptidyl-prolyl cis-trans isomerase SurA n=1 Tax=Tenacibaculum vairaonense TaxID=3137860 RepID=A0ABM9PR55_9FLAO
MKKQILGAALLFNAFLITGQSKNELFSINNKSISVAEFKRVYEKNLSLVVDKDSKDIDKYLDLYINYKLKVGEAYALGLDTISTYKRELEGYKKQLIAPYLQDKESIKKLVNDAYYRTKNEVRASHILIRFTQKGKEQDTVAAFNKIKEVRKRVVNGEDFKKVAREVSEDPSAKFNAGDLGYFSAFRMVFPFEENAYTTKIGEVSEPFRTRFGYHILKVTGKRESKGQFEVAHILRRDQSIVGKVKIDSAYQKLQKGVAFESVVKEYSEDVGTAQLGGKLPKFGTGSMVESFEKAVLELKKEGEYSKPFKTKYGWHIVKLLKNYPIASFDEMKQELEKKVKKSARMGLSKDAVINKLRQEYNVKVNKKALVDFKNNSKEGLATQKLDKILLSINKKQITQKEFYDFIKYRSYKNVDKLFKDFKNKEIIDYFKDDLVNKEPEYKYTLLEYKEGLLLFELMQQKIWKKSSNDSIGLKKFYASNKPKYSKELEEIKGEVISDYQKQLEDNWISELRKNNVIKVKKKALKKLKKVYNQ